MLLPTNEPQPPVGLTSYSTEVYALTLYIEDAGELERKYRQGTMQEPH